MHQNLRLLVLKTALVALLACPVLPAFGQDGLAPRDEQVLLSDGCVLAPSSVTADGHAISVWHRDYQAGGIYARSGQRFDSLGPATQLFAEEYTGDPKVAPIAGGFVMAWNATGGMRFQRFAADLTPLDAAVLFEPNGSSLAIDEDGAGGFLLAWVSSGSGLKARRFSAAGTPLTPILDVAPGTIFHTRVKAGSGGFAVSWSDDYIAGTAHVRAFSNAGAPLGASFDAGTGVVELAPLPTGYLLLRNWSGFFTRVLGSDGQALAAEIALGLSGISPLLGQGEDATWLAWQDSETRILGARLDPQGRLEGEPTEVAATIDSTYFVLTHLTPRPGAFQLTWSHYEQGVIPLGPCEYNLGGMTQSFGASRGPVDVPLATPNGRIVLLLLFLVAGLVALRRASPV